MGGGTAIAATPSRMALLQYNTIVLERESVREIVGFRFGIDSVLNREGIVVERIFP